jgi:hypothetical protein
MGFNWAFKGLKLTTQTKMFVRSGMNVLVVIPLCEFTVMDKNIDSPSGTNIRLF